jgi:hypothetical protein
MCLLSILATIWSLCFTSVQHPHLDDHVFHNNLFIRKNSINDVGGLSNNDLKRLNWLYRYLALPAFALSFM